MIGRMNERQCGWTCDYALHGTNDRASQWGYIHCPYSVDIAEIEKRCRPRRNIYASAFIIITGYDFFIISD